MEVQENTRIGNYLLTRKLARGGMSQVYLARDERSQREVAIKIVSKENSEHAGRFQQEIKVLSRLSHEHILPVLDSGEEGQWLYMVMPYIEDGTLRDLLHTKGRLTPEEAGKILVQVCEALQFAHNAGVLHRDIKPSNILLQRGEHVYLSDFGLVKGIEESGELTRTGCLIGTPEYMAPELAEQPASKSSDIYALGIVLYQMLTGKTPFRAPTPLAIYWKQIQEQPVRPSLLEPAIPVCVEQVVLCALEKNPQLRFKSPMALARAYAQALLYARREQRTGKRITAPLATAASVSTGPLAAQTPTAPETGRQKLFDMRDLKTVMAANRIAAAKAGRSRLTRKVMTGMLAVTLLLGIPFSFGYSLYNNAAHTYTAWGASAPFSSVLVDVGGSSRKPSPTPTATRNSTHQSVVVFHPQSQPHQSPPPKKHKHGHKHNH
jgi:serine/threonine protein kinase